MQVSYRRTSRGDVVGQEPLAAPKRRRDEGPDLRDDGAARDRADEVQAPEPDAGGPALVGEDRTVGLDRVLGGVQGADAGGGALKAPDSSLTGFSGGGDRNVKTVNSKKPKMQNTKKPKNQ